MEDERNVVALKLPGNVCIIIELEPQIKGYNGGRQFWCTEIPDYSSFAYEYDLLKLTCDLVFGRWLLI